MSYKVMYHAGPEIDLKTKANTGRLSLDDDHLVIHGDPAISIPLVSLHSAELFRLHGTGRMLKLVHDGGTLFVTVIRFSLFGLFAVVNFFGTGRLHKELQSAIATRRPPMSGEPRR